MKQCPFLPYSLSSLSDALQLCLFQQQGSQDSLGSPFTLLFLKGRSGSTRPVSLDTHTHTHCSVKPCGWLSWKRKCWLKLVLLCLPSTEQTQFWTHMGPSCSLSWPWCTECTLGGCWAADYRAEGQQQLLRATGLNSMCKFPSRAFKALCTGNRNHREGEGGEEVDLVTEQASCLQGTCLECQVRVEASQHPTQSLI